MAQNKTRPTVADVAQHIDSLDAEQRDDCRVLVELLHEVTREPPTMWGPSIVGFGQYHYRYDSGREGDSPLIGFAARKRELVVYLAAGTDEQQALLARLGRHRAGKSCLYIRKLADVDATILRRLVEAALVDISKHHGKVVDGVV